MIKKATLRVSGRVQGLCYRAETQAKAFELKLKGFAQNNRDGSVTVVAVGEESALQKLIEWCKKGPELARVDDIKIAYDEPKPDEFTEFEIY